MINEIYINGKLVLDPTPRNKFKMGYKIKCVICNQMIDRRTFDKKILEVEYECKICALKYKNPMYNPNVKERHDKIVKSKEYREHMSSLLSGKNNPFYGKTHTQENIEKIIKSNENYRNNLTNDERQLISDKFSNFQKKLLKENPIDYRRKRAKAARKSHISQFENKKMNKIEKVICNYLEDVNINFKYSVILASYQFDFGIKDKRILIEVDGDYWHGNPKYYNKNGSFGKRKLNEIQLNKIERDIEKTKWAESRGFTIIRIWESEIKDGSYIHKLNEIKKNK